MFQGFTFASEVLLGRLARFYGLSIPEGHHETSLADFVRAGPGCPTIRPWAIASALAVSGSLLAA